MYRSLISILKSEKGFTETMALGAAALFALFIAGLYAYRSSTDPALEAEARMDLRTVIDRAALSFASEEECTLAFKSAPLNALNFVEGDKGDIAMDFVAPIVFRSLTIAAVGENLIGGQVNKVWLENETKHPNMGALRHFQVQFKVAAMGGGFGVPVVEALQMGVLVDAANKIQYCYTDESVAINTCKMAGGYLDPNANPKCRFNFTQTTCTDANSCVTGLDTSGNLVCSNVMIPPPPPPPPSQWCVCGCTPQMGLPSGTACGLHNHGVADVAGACFGSPGTCTNYTHPTDQQGNVGDPYPGIGGIIEWHVDLEGCVLLDVGNLPGGC